MKILFATSEAHPLIKTGGLADVSGSLPVALQQDGHDVRLVLPAYRQVLAKLEHINVIAHLDIFTAPETVRILEATLPNSDVTVWLVDAPTLFDRDGGPYATTTGDDWEDNGWRFAVFGRTVVELAMDRAELQWRPDVVHGNDWQCGIAHALLHLEPHRPASIFTIHNLAYQGLFSRAVFDGLLVPPQLWSPDGMEFYDRVSFIKGGLSYADRITTVSPTYAQEIRHAEFAYGLEGLLTHRAGKLVGILNGIDYGDWNPETDAHIEHHYSAENLDGKQLNKQSLQNHFELPNEDVPLFGLVGRLVGQKGIDLVIEALPDLLERGAQIVILGSGEKRFEKALLALAEQHPGQIGVHIGYDETLAHRIEAGADIFLMPSRFEPCGLNQLYSLRYGTLPMVRRTGGLADTVVDSNDQNLADGSATGFVFNHPNSAELIVTINRAITLYRDNPKGWQQVMKTGMNKDFSWERSAARYGELYDEALSERF